MTTTHEARLERVLGTVPLTLYGLGVTIGAGIYVLVGEVAGVAGYAAPVAFVLAAVLAGLSALSYSEMAVRLPQAGGDAAYVEAAFSRRWLTLAIGLTVAFSGITSSGAVIIGFAGYFEAISGLSGPLVIVGAVAALAFVAFWGVRESFALIGLTTLLEVGGLVLVIWAGAPALERLPDVLPLMWPGLDGNLWLAVLSGSVLAFFAFIGFEDIVNMAEETRDVARTMPRAIILTLVCTTVLYLLLATISVLAVPPEELSRSAAPLALIFERGGGDARILGGIAMLAVVNGALIQIIKASRLLYGMARLGRLPRWLVHVHPRRKTPDRAILAVALLVLAFALALPIGQLAGLASLSVLGVFATVNAALLRVRLRGDPSPSGYRVPLAVPVAGLIATVLLLAFGLIDLVR